MTPEEMEVFVVCGQKERCLASLAPLTEPERRKLSKAALSLYRDLMKTDTGLGDHLIPRFERKDVKWTDQRAAASALVFGTATLSEMKSLSYRTELNYGCAYEALSARRPEWLGGWADWTLDQGLIPQWGRSDTNWHAVRRLVREGICTTPTSDAYIYLMIPVAAASCETRLGHPNTSVRDWLGADQGLLDYEIWRLFETEGTTAVSLASSDKFLAEGFGWFDSLLALCKGKRLDRDRLLAASLDALQRDFAPFRAGWFSRFHEALKPTPDERAGHADTYLALVSSRTAATVSFALRALSEIDRAGKLPAASVIDAMAPALAAREKGTTMAALRLLERAAKAEPTLASRAAGLAAEALIHPTTDVQGKALDLIEKLADRCDYDLRADLASRLDDVAPSLRGRLSALVPSESRAAASQSSAAGAGEAEELTARAKALDPHWAALAGVPEALADFHAGTLSAPALRLNPLTVPRLDPNRRIQPVQTVDELIDLFAAVIENGGPPDDVERVMDGVSRLCAQRPPDFERHTSALAKRAREACGITRNSGHFRPVANLVARIAVAWIDKKIVYSPEQEPSLFGFFERRATEVACRIAFAEAAPLLAAPTHSGGWIDPRVAVERFRARAGRPVQRSAPRPGLRGFLTTVREHFAQGDGPDRYDMIQGLLRLAPDHRDEALKLAESIPGETGDVLRYALGAGRAAIGRDAALWIAAARARDPLADHPEIERRFPGLGPGGGQAARITIHWVPREDIKHKDVDIVCEPAAPKKIPQDMPTVMHYAWRKVWYRWEMFIWGELGELANIWPLNRSPWLALGASRIGDNVNWWEARWDDRHFIEMLADPDTPLAGFGADMLAFGLAAKEAGQAGAAADALIAAIADGRITAADLGGALAEAIRLPDIVPSRWARTLADAARISSLHHAAIISAIERLFASSPARKPVEMVSLIELEHELCVAAGSALCDPAARSWLAGISGSGKAAKLAKSLLDLVPSAPASAPAAAADQLRGRLSRAERWQRMTR